jgi:hypothetical protein
VLFEDSNHPRAASDFWQGHYVSYRRKVKNGDSEHKAHNNVEHIFGDDFQHSLPPIQVKEH